MTVLFLFRDSMEVTRGLVLCWLKETDWQRSVVTALERRRVMTAVLRLTRTDADWQYWAENGLIDGGKML
jgi:hypothetical protein